MAKTDLNVAFVDMSRVWTVFSVWITIAVLCHRLQRDFLQHLDSLNVWAGKAGSAVHHFIPFYFHSANVEISEVPDNLVEISRSFMPWSSEGAYTTRTELLKFVDIIFQ